MSTSANSNVTFRSDDTIAYDPDEIQTMSGNSFATLHHTVDTASTRTARGPREFYFRDDILDAAPAIIEIVEKIWDYVFDNTYEMDDADYRMWWYWGSEGTDMERRMAKDRPEVRDTFGEAVLAIEESFIAPMLAVIGVTPHTAQNLRPGFGVDPPDINEQDTYLDDVRQVLYPPKQLQGYSYHPLP